MNSKISAKISAHEIVYLIFKHKPTIVRLVTVQIFFFFSDKCSTKICSYNAVCMENTSKGRTATPAVKCVCPSCYGDDSYKPVCGDNGETFSSKCFLDKENCLSKKLVRIVKEVPCGL